MYHVYIVDESAFDSRKLLCEFSDLDMAKTRLQKEIAKDSEIKYVIEQTTGHVDSYGDLVATVIEEN